MYIYDCCGMEVTACYCKWHAGKYCCCNCKFYSLLKLLITCCCSIAFDSMAWIVSCRFLVNHSAVYNGKKHKLGFRTR